MAGLAQSGRWGIAALLLCLPTLAGAPEYLVLQDVRVSSVGEVTRVAIQLSGPAEIRRDKLARPDRYFFDFQHTIVVRRGVWTVPVNDPRLRQVRVAVAKPGVARVVLDLTEDASVTTSELSNPYRLMIELKGSAKNGAGADGPISSRSNSPVPPAVSSTHGAGAELQAKSLPPATSTPPGSTIRRTAARMPIPAAAEAEPADLPTPPVITLIGTASQIPALQSGFRFPPYTWATTSPRTGQNATRNAAARSAATTPSAPPSVVKPPSIAKREPAQPVGSAPNAPEVLASNPTPAASTPTVRPPSAKSEPGTSASPARRTTAGDSSLTRALGLKIRRVVLDPGHGGHDQGSAGPTGLLEKELVLDVAKRLGSLLEKNLGSAVIYTRSDDRFIPLEQRTQIANQSKADLFLSIHANSSGIRTVSGIETYYLSFTTSKEALEVAARENATSDRGVFELRDLLQKIALQEKVDESREFASRINTSMFRLWNTSNAAARNRGVKKAPFVVLIGASMPSVLAEIGFLSNPRDEKEMKKGDVRQKMAEALYRGIAQYAESLSHFAVARAAAQD